MDDRHKPGVRPAIAEDAARIAGLLTELGYPAGAGEVAERLAYWLPDQASQVLVAERDGVVVGCVSLHAIPYLERTGRCCGSRAWWSTLASAAAEPAGR